MTQTAPAPQGHSTLLGGSIAARRVACPGSYALERKLPPQPATDAHRPRHGAPRRHRLVPHVA